MNFSSSRTLRISALALIALVSTSISYSASATTQSIGKAKVSATVLPTVTAHAGVAPVLGKPAGNPPTVLTKKDIILGKGKAAVSSSTVTAQYVLMSWKTGKVLQSSWSSGPFTSPLSGVITGWQQGIPGMKVGGRRLLVIPPALAYGAAGGGPVGPNETLVFVVDLLGVK
jgi:peptidylprolyl isomerase